MWTCAQCGAGVDDALTICPECSACAKAPPLPDIIPAEEPAPPAEPAGRTAVACYRIFKGGSFVSWDALFAQAAGFVSTLGPDRVISISHSADHNQGIVTVWYWDA